MSPPHHPDPPERAFEPQFAATLGPERTPHQGLGSGLDGPVARRPRGRSLAPWALLAGLLALVAWTLVTVGLPLRQEALQCQAQLLAAQSAYLAPPDVEPPPDGGSPSSVDGLSQAQVDALVERLVLALGPEAALGEVAVHPDEGCVRVVVAGDVEGAEALRGLFGRVAREVRAMPTRWQVVLEAGRPRWQNEAKPRGHGVHEPASRRLLLRAMAAADSAFGAAEVPWVTRLWGRPDGSVVLRLEAEPVAQAVLSPAGTGPNADTSNEADGAQ